MLLELWQVWWCHHLYLSGSSSQNQYFIFYLFIYFLLSTKAVLFCCHRPFIPCHKLLSAFLHFHFQCHPGVNPAPPSSSNQLWTTLPQHPRTGLSSWPAWASFSWQQKTNHWPVYLSWEQDHHTPFVQNALRSLHEHARKVPDVIIKRCSPITCTQSCAAC